MYFNFARRLQTKKSKAIMVIMAPFGTSEKAGHLISDDLYYFDYLVSSARRFIYILPEFSYFNILECRGKASAQYLKIKDMVSTLFPPSCDHLVFVGYSEVEAFIVFAFNFWRIKKLSLIATNNISQFRTRKYKLPLRIFFGIISSRLCHLVLHSEYEKTLCMNLSKRLHGKILLKKHHLMSPKNKIINGLGASKRDRLIISFWGPIKHDKPLQPFIDLIKADVHQAFCYKLFSVQSDVVEESDNVTIANKWIDECELAAEINGIDLIFMSHTPNYEGKLSGNLCDSIAYFKPFISRRIEPFVTYDHNFNVGYFYEQDKIDWPLKFLKSFSKDNYLQKKKNLEALARDHSRSNIYKDLAAVFT